MNSKKKIKEAEENVLTTIFKNSFKMAFFGIFSNFDDFPRGKQTVKSFLKR
jgi:hypothetical protein